MGVNAANAANPWSTTTSGTGRRPDAPSHARDTNAPTDARASARVGTATAGATRSRGATHGSEAIVADMALSVPRARAPRKVESRVAGAHGDRSRSRTRPARAPRGDCTVRASPPGRGPKCEGGYVSFLTWARRVSRSPRAHGRCARPRVGRITSRRHPMRSVRSSCEGSAPHGGRFFAETSVCSEVGCSARDLK